MVYEVALVKPCDSVPLTFVIDTFTETGGPGETLTIRVKNGVKPYGEGTNRLHVVTQKVNVKVKTW